MMYYQIYIYCAAAMFSFNFLIFSYQINAHTELAIRYNDISPLENHHAAVTFQLLERVRDTSL